MMKVILRDSVLTFLLVAAITSAVAAKSEFERQLDSLFVIASSAEIQYQNLRDPAMNQIASYGANAVPYLIEKFSTRSSWDRWTLTWIFQRIGKPAVPLLVKALERPDDLVVQRVAAVLGDIKDSSAVDGLMGVCRHKSWQVRDEALGALGRIGDGRAFEVVLQAFDDSVGQVRKAAVVACGQLKESKAVERLVHCLGDDFYGTRLTAINALLRMDTARVIAVISDSIESPNELLGNVACRVLGRLGTEPALNLLIYQTESIDLERRAHAAEALAQADPEDHCNFRQRYLEAEPDRLARLKVESALHPVQHEK